MKQLAEESCRPLPAGTPPLAQKDVDAGLAQLPGWEQRDGAICKRFAFRDFVQTMAFVNKVAVIAAREDHHPEMQVGYDRCSITYSTHSVGGISRNDLVCAAKIETL